MSKDLRNLDSALGVIAAIVVPVLLVFSAAFFFFYFYVPSQETAQFVGQNLSSEVQDKLVSTQIDRMLEKHKEKDSLAEIQASEVRDIFATHP